VLGLQASTTPDLYTHTVCVCTYAYMCVCIHTYIFRQISISVLKQTLEQLRKVLFPERTTLVTNTIVKLNQNTAHCSINRRGSMRRACWDAVYEDVYWAVGGELHLHERKKGKNHWISQQNVQTENTQKGRHTSELESAHILVSRLLKKLKFVKFLNINVLSTDVEKELSKKHISFSVQMWTINWVLSLI
jgi:hypothetical protein